ncbi:hypothetical protein BJ170DRAFT_248734 [Xylariales sp. AK1849]|nr:hypothetical protein BJ170DRAFT_248734 [Xylariales sp. AK1849]
MADQATAANTRRSPSPPERIKSSAEDPDTAATRKEFDNTAISEKPNSAAMTSTAPDPASDAVAASDTSAVKKTTPELDVPDTQIDKLKDQISSPKKKRAHDEVEQTKDAPQDPNGDVSPIGANGSSSLGRTNRSEPEKKRARDVSSETKEGAETSTDTKANDISSTESATPETHADTLPAAEKDATSATSTSAFKSSGLSGFAASPSPFLQAGAKPLTSFASASASSSTFGASGASKSEAPSAFGGGGSLANGSSPFGQIGGAPKPFGGSVFGGGFGGGLGGVGSTKLTSFAKPGEAFKSSKPIKAFGAPESDAETDDDEVNDDAKSNDGETEKLDKEEKDAEGDKKKTKLQKVAVDDGETGEATILQVRAKIYHLDKKVTPPAWKERGAGNLRVNVPKSCVDLDEGGLPLPGSFDASALEDSETKVVRLIMRQDSTHRVVLNTTVIPAMKFQEKSTNKAVCVLFTAIEDEGAVSIQLKLNPANAKSFLNEVGKIQRELQSS